MHILATLLTDADANFESQVSKPAFKLWMLSAAQIDNKFELSSRVSVVKNRRKNCHIIVAKILSWFLRNIDECLCCNVVILVHFNYHSVSSRVVCGFSSLSRSHRTQIHHGDLPTRWIFPNYTISIDDIDSDSSISMLNEDFYLLFNDFHTPETSKIDDLLALNIFNL